MPKTYIIKNDNNKIEFCRSETHKTKSDAKGKLVKEKLPEPIMIFNYIESSTKSGEVRFTESDFNKLVKMGNIVEL